MNWSAPYYSDALGMRYSVHSDGRVATEDRTLYSAEEVQVIARTTREIDPLAHMVKRAFDGKIVDYNPPQ